MTEASAPSATGEVVAFDDHKGYGTVRAADGQELFFHCTAIADGTRTIPVGTRVTFAIVTGRMGPEATDLQPG